MTTRLKSRLEGEAGRGAPLAIRTVETALGNGIIDPCQTFPIPGGVHRHPENVRVPAVTLGETLGDL